MARKGENIFKRADGRWEARYIKGRKNNKAVYGYVFGKSYLEAKEKKAAAISALLADTGKPSLSVTKQQPTMMEIGNLWLDSLKPARKKSTIVKYDSQLRNHIFPAFGDKCIDEIANEDLIAFGNRLLTGNSNGSEKLSPKSVSDILSRMKSIRRFALIRGYEVRYIPDCITVPQAPGDIRVFSLTEEKVLLHYLKEHPDLTSLGIILCLFTGIRVGELCALTWSDISLTDRELHVKRTMQRLKNLDGNAKKKTYIDIDEPKSRCSIRTIPIPDNIMEDLSGSYVSGAYVLTGKAKRYVEPRTMENRFKSILKKCGIADATVHTCRHSFATRCVEAGFDIKSLSEILGHANVNITLNRYIHPTMQMKRENMNKLSGLFAVK
ncbi:MAG: site-specific integrase [Eubacterium sp.]|nr:site-specific integrase [Eubacterium sp.]